MMKSMDFKARSTSHFVVVHGGCFGAWCWYKVADLLSKAGHTVSALDMASGGIDPRDADHITTLAQYDQPLTDFIASFSSDEKVILVGHSVGGFDLSLTMELFPHKILAAVFVTAAMPLSGTTLSDFVNAILGIVGSFGDSTYYYANGEANAPTSFKFGKLRLREHLLQNSPSTDATLTDSLIKKYPFWGGAISHTKERYGSVPRAYVVCKEDKLLVEELQRKIIADNPPQLVYEIERSDHSPFFSAPSELVEILIQIAEKY